MSFTAGTAVLPQAIPLPVWLEAAVPFGFRQILGRRQGESRALFLRGKELKYLQEADVAIIGAGVAGTALTYHLAKDGARVILIEQGYLGEGTSGATMSNLNLHNRLPGPELDLALNTLRLYEDLLHNWDTDIQFEKTSGLMLLSTPEMIPWAQKRVSAQKNAGLDIKML